MIVVRIWSFYIRDWIFGAERGLRTPDLTVISRALYQAKPPPRNVAPRYIKIYRFNLIKINIKLGLMINSNNK